MSIQSQTAVASAADQAPATHRRQLSEGARAERRLGWLLCAPAVIVMIAVTAYPIAYAVYLSLQRYNLELPNAVKFIGLSNYAAVLTSPVLVARAVRHADHHGRLGRHRACPRHAARPADAPHDCSAGTPCARRR